MSITPHHPAQEPTPRPSVPQHMMAPGWYPDPTVPGMQRYHDGTAWTQHVAPAAQVAPQQVVVNVGGVSHLSGMSTGGHIVHGILTVMTLGLWAPIWWLKWRLGRRAIR